jgi:isoleucyl-tRNA synthetase
MEKQYKEYKQLNLPEIAAEVEKIWKKENTFEKSISSRNTAPDFVFYEGPPSANGLPGIHHVMARSIKDIFCRYKTQKGFKVNRKAGWDTHGLPIELGVEKKLGITKEDIGTKITVEDYNKACKEEVMKYTDVWNDLTEKMGYWVDMENPYITYDNKYIETVWYLLSKLYQKNLLYKGYTIQPYSPAAGTGLSSHELNQPGCYKNVKDTSVIAQFKVSDISKLPFAIENNNETFFIAWTTTPWTLPSNTALAVGAKIEYVLVQTFNQYTFEPVNVILAKDLASKYFSEKNADLSFEDFQNDAKKIPFKTLATCKGKDLDGIRYEQLLPYVQPTDGDAFRVVLGDFVTTEDGTGIVHIAPSFGADDFMVAKKNGIGALTLVDLQGKFVNEVTDFAGMYVKEAYEDASVTADKDYKNTDVKIAIFLKEKNRAFKVEKYEHSYPHCWRTDKPILYYPLDSWFIKTTDAKERLIELNKTINWKPASTGTGRFGNWLENLQDWNLSRSRFWGIPLPIWSSEDMSEQKCIGSIAELKIEIEKAIAKGFMKENPLEKFNDSDFSKENYETFDLHRPYADNIVLVSDSGKALHREKDLIDVWFDSGAMPYAQLHYPFENKEVFDKNFPADFIAEGVDQTRGWFFTLHTIATMCFDSIAYKNVISNGLVLDKNGQKMSKRLGNAIDPFTTLSKYGPDATRWYMITNAQPWDNLKFDLEGIAEVQRKFFGTLYNTYNFFALYANIDGFKYAEAKIHMSERQEIDRWIISELNTLIKEVDQAYDDFEPTKAGRLIQYFVNEHLSNWYVRLCRRRFWKGDYSNDKISAYQTLFECLFTISKLSAPIAPFYMDKLYRDLNNIAQLDAEESVHIAKFPIFDNDLIDSALEERMQLAQKFSSMILSIRKKENIKVRQPLQKVIVPVLDQHFKSQIEAIQDLILSEVNVKELEFLTEDSGIIVKQIKPNFKTIGPKYGKQMKAIAVEVAKMGQADIKNIELNNGLKINIEGEDVSLNYEDFEITSKDIPGWSLVNDGKHTVALDLNITADLKQEGIAREIINRFQNLRKDSGLEVTDRIEVHVVADEEFKDAILTNKQYICEEILANNIQFVDNVMFKNVSEIEFDENKIVKISLEKAN